MDLKASRSPFWIPSTSLWTSGVSVIEPDYTLNTDEHPPQKVAKYFAQFFYKKIEIFSATFGGVAHLYARMLPITGKLPMGFYPVNFLTGVAGVG